MKTVLDILLSKKVIPVEEYRNAEKMLGKSSLKIEEILLRKGVLQEADILSARAELYGYPYFEKLSFEQDEVFEKLPLALIQKSRIVPVKKSGKTITLALSDPSLIHPMDDMRGALKGYRVKFIISPDAEISRIIHSHFDAASEAAREVMEGIAAEGLADFDFDDENLSLTDEAPIIRMVNAVLSQAVQERASDIHIEPYDKSLDIRYRIDGILHKRLNPPRAVHAGLVSRIKIMANLNIAENRLPQDGRIKIRLAGKEVDIRVSVIPTRYGERVVMRLLNKSDSSYSITNLGIANEIHKNILSILNEPNGIFLVTGPTGSGKTTTLYAFLSELNEETRNIITVEDPVEYEIDGISQMQMQEKIGLTFAASLRAILRQDPDVIMVGEIRDEETARIAIQASLTGHLVFSTLHTNDSASAVTRLMDMSIEPYLITSTVRGVLAQRLVRTICPRCKKEYMPSKSELNDFGISTSDLKGKKLFKGEGCSECVGTGYRGRMGIYELLLLDDAVQKAILSGKDADGIKEAAGNKLITLHEYGRSKVMDGLTTIEEVMRVT